MKKQRKARPWWRKRRTLRRVAIAAASLIVIGAWAWFVFGQSGSNGSETHLVQPAPAFTLPTIDNGTYVSSDHLGKHNMLLYFNEGMG
jgi:hypothetical protein